MSVTLDYHFDDKAVKINTLWKSTAFVFLPIIIALAVTGSYFIMFMQPEPSRVQWASGINVYAFLMSLLYAAVGKTFLFYKNKQAAGDAE
jgi:small neutral amino acid transporter SnatA (MarC family)